jgi:hypothetical protein
MLLTDICEVPVLNLMYVIVYPDGGFVSYLSLSTQISAQYLQLNLEYSFPNPFQINICHQLFISHYSLSS